MRLNWSRMKRSALGAAFAATCISSMQFSGCIKNSARDLATADISAEAEQAALEAERDIEERRQKDALIAARDKDSSDMRLSSASVEKELAQAEANESPLAKFLRGKNNPPPQQDPFLAADSAKQETRAESLDELLASKGVEKTRQGRDSIQQTNAEREATRPSTSVWDDLIKEHLDEAPSTTSAKPGTATLADSGEVPEWAKSDKKTAVASTTPPPKEDDQWDAIFGLTDAKPAQEKKSQFVMDLDPASNVAATEPAAAVENPFAATAPDSPAAEPANDRAELRIEELLAQARSQEANGNLKGAYRSALMAEAIAIDNGIQFSSRDQSPASLAKNLSDKIWGKPTQPTEAPVWPSQERRRLEPTQSPALATRQRDFSTRRHDDVFQADESFPQWKAIPNGNAPVNFERRDVEETRDLRDMRSFHSSQRSSFESSFNSGTGSSQTQPSFPAPAFPSTSASESKGPVLRAPLEAAVHADAEWKTASNTPQRDVQLTAVQANAPLEITPPTSVVVEADKFSRPPKSENRASSSLTAPLTPPVLANASADVSETISLDQGDDWDAAIAEVDTEATAESEPQGGWKWALIGLCAAIVSTLIGLKLARAEEVASPDPTASNEEEDDDSKPQLRIRRAA